MSNTVSDKIQESATGPKRVKGDSGEVEQHSLADQIAADKHLGAKAAVSGRKLGIRFGRLIPPGTV